MTRYFEDLPVGLRVDLGQVTVTADEIVEFATRWDPQVFHTDPVRAQDSSFGGLVASGVHTLGVFVRCYADGLLIDAAGLGSPGLDELRWPAPVRPGDTLRATFSVISARKSVSRPDRGIVRGIGELTNQRGETVLHTELINMFGRVPGEPPDGQE